MSSLVLTSDLLSSTYTYYIYIFILMEYMYMKYVYVLESKSDVSRGGHKA